MVFTNPPPINPGTTTKNSATTVLNTSHGLRSARFKTGPYTRSLNPSSKRPTPLSNRLGGMSLRRAFECATCAGKMSAPSINENSNVTMMTTAMSPNTSPNRPSMKKNAPNATTVVNTAAATAGNTSRVPFTAASKREAPRSWCWKMFSAMTMPSSTRMPTTMIRPNNEMTLMVMPNQRARANIPANETGIESATQNDSRQFRNSAKNKMTKKNPWIPCSVSRSMRCRSTTDPSRTTSSRSPLLSALY